jgi:formylglycine-generating enzyme required for sulfatase activity
MDMDNETKEKAAALAGEAKEKAVGIWSKCAGKIGALWKSGTKGKVICIVGSLAVVGMIAVCVDDDEDGGGGGGGRGGWTYSDKDFYDAVNGGATEDEGTVYGFDGKGLKVLQSTSEGVLVESTGDGDRMIWVVTKKRYEDGAKLAAGYYIRRGMMEYESLIGIRTIARYDEVTGNLLAKVKKHIEDEKAAAEAKAKADAEAKAKAKAEREAANAKAKAQIAAMSDGKRAGETTTITLPGGVMMEMVWCPPGTFTMGTPKDEKVPTYGFTYKDTQHQVTLTKGFWMGKTEVTQVQWKSVMGNNPSEHNGDALPVERVSWEKCQIFCERLGLQLPTEAQWEYACRAGSTGPYAGSGNLDEMGWYKDNSEEKTHPVGTKQPNAWGLYDMHGNVCEWCADWHGDYSDGAETDPKGGRFGDSRVCRGGGYAYRANSCRSASRFGSSPSSGDSGQGFRVVRVPSE